MKTLIATIFLVLVTGTGLMAQFAPLSPRINIRQQLGHGNVTIETTRPMARGRKIFGGLVPYDKLWFTGAGGTFLTFDKSVKIAGQEAPASRYALMIVPGKTEWTIRLSRNSVMPDSPDYDYGKEISVCLPVTRPGRFYEAWSVEMDLTPGNARLYLSWTDAQVSIPIETGSELKAMAIIDSLAAAPLSNDLDTYYRTVNYLNFNKISMDKVVLFANHIVSLEEENRYYAHEILAEAYRSLGKKKQALAELKKIEAILPREFPGDTEAISSISARVARMRAEIEGVE